MLSNEDTFWERVDRSGGSRACWLWRGSVSSGSIGYGTLKFRNSFEYAHRVAWVLSEGDIPDGKEILHRCDNPACCNPLHMMVGTRAENAADMAAKGRSRRAGIDRSPERNARQRAMYAIRKQRKLDAEVENG